MVGKQQIAVVGASGHTGRFVLQEIEWSSSAAIAIGRDFSRLPPGGRVASLDDPKSLDFALAGADAVINCAGPFMDTAFPVLDAAIRAGIPYLDVCAEQATVLSLYRERHVQVREAGITALPGMAFYGGLGDLLATAACGDWTSPDAIDVAVALDSWLPTAGTRETGRRNKARRQIVRGGRLKPVPEPALRRSWDFAQPFGELEIVATPLTETILINRHLGARAVTAYMNLAPLEDLQDPQTPPPKPVDELGRSAQRFLVEVEVTLEGEVRRASAAGRDIYAVTAPLVVAAAHGLLDCGTPSGVLAPGEVFEAAAFLRRLASETFRPSI